MLYHESSQNAPALKWSREKEDETHQDYIKHMSVKHADFVGCSCGVVVDPSIDILEPLLMDLYFAVVVDLVLWRSNVHLSIEITCLLLKNHYQIRLIFLKEMQLEKFIFPRHTNITIKFKIKLL